MSRPEKCRRICSKPKIRHFAPVEQITHDKVILGYDEYESVRLIDNEHYSQQECAGKMGVSRSTVARIYGVAREKLADALVNGKALHIDGGDVIVCAKMRPECRDVLNCCHRIKQMKD